MVAGVKSRWWIAWLTVDCAHDVSHHAFKPVQRAPRPVRQQLDADASLQLPATIAARRDVFSEGPGTRKHR